MERLKLDIPTGPVHLKVGRNAECEPCSSRSLWRSPHSLHSSNRDADDSTSAGTNETTAVTSMFDPRYVVSDDAPRSLGLDCTADQFADALRAPLAAIGVRVVRQHGARSNPCRAAFQAQGCSRSQYRAKLNTVEGVVNGVMTRSIAAKFRDCEQ